MHGAGRPKLHAFHSSETLRVGTLFSTVLSLDTGLKGVCQLFPIDGSAPLGQHKSTERSTREVLALSGDDFARTMTYVSLVVRSVSPSTPIEGVHWPSGQGSGPCGARCPVYIRYIQKKFLLSHRYIHYRALATNWLPGSSTGRDCDDSQSGGGGVRGGSGQWGMAS